MSKKVSVVLTTYNRPSLLERSLGSVLNQTFCDWECIVVDDASDESVKSIVESFNDSRIRYYRHKKNRGLSAARNTGLRLASSSMVAFLDDDDEWLPKKLEKQVECLEQAERDVALVHSWMETVRNGDVVDVKCPELKGDIFKHTIDRQPLGNGSTWLLRRSSVIEKGGFDESLPRGVDGDLIRRLSKEYKVDYVPEVLVRYYIGHGNKRITRLKHGGAENAVISEKTKLSKFEEFFQDNPALEARVRSGLGFYHVASENYHDAYVNYKKAIYLSPLEAKIYKEAARSLMLLLKK